MAIVHIPMALAENEYLVTKPEHVRAIIGDMSDDDPEAVCHIYIDGAPQHARVAVSVEEAMGLVGWS